MHLLFADLLLSFRAESFVCILCDVVKKERIILSSIEYLVASGVGEKNDNGHSMPVI